MRNYRDFREIVGVLGMALLGIPLLIILVLFGGAWLFDTIVSSHSISTTDAPSYTENKFSKIATGMTSDDVTKLLGKPVSVSHASTNVQEWHFTKPKTPIVEWSTWNVRALVLSNDRVLRIIKEREQND